MIDWADIEELAEEARRKVRTVKEVLFEGSGHCAHLAMDERRHEYVGAVNSVCRGNGEGSEVLVAQTLAQRDCPNSRGVICNLHR